MKASLATMVLAATAALASSASNSHQRFHQRKAAARAAVDTRSDDAATVAVWTAFYTVIGQAAPFSAAGNSNVSNSDNLDYKNTIINNAGEDLILAVWANGDFKLGEGGVEPQLTQYIHSGATTTISMVDGFSGAMSFIGAGTGLSPGGQISNTFLELTTGSSGVVDVSRLVNANGNAVSVQQSQCTTSMTQCVYTCNNGAETCWTAGSYTLTNCATGSQPGANNGDNVNGGCNIEKQMTTTVGPIASS